MALKRFEHIPCVFMHFVEREPFSSCIFGLGF